LRGSGVCFDRSSSAVSSRKCSAGLTKSSISRTVPCPKYSRRAAPSFCNARFLLQDFFLLFVFMRIYKFLLRSSSNPPESCLQNEMRNVESMKRSLNVPGSLSSALTPRIFLALRLTNHCHLIRWESRAPNAQAGRFQNFQCPANPGSSGNF